MVTSQKDQIQSLIADIERALGKERPKTPWVKTSETEPQREALARAQAYLMSLQQSFDAPGGWGPVDPTTGQIADAPPVAAVSAPTLDASAENVLQALLTEMKFLKSSALEPLRLEMNSLREARDRLSEEVKALAERRNQVQQESQQAELARVQQENISATAVQAVDEDQLNQFLQALMVRLQENLSMQVTNTLSQLESEHSAAMAKLTAATEIEILELKPTGQIEEMRQLQSRSDQLLTNIDSTLQGMFETLQTNIDSYQISLNEGIDNMHSLGRQGEVIVRSLVDHLTQQLGQTVPPEPAFYPSSSSLADTTEQAMEPTADTVSSLNEILPATSRTPIEPMRSETVVSADTSAEAIQTEMTFDGVIPTDAASLEITEVPQPQTYAETEAEREATQAVDEEPASSSAQIAELLIAESAVDDSATADSATEDFIREDGTIDLDLLKLDIDRTEDDPSLSRDDLMIDSAIADAQVADSEAESLEIESQVMSTADSAFLASLTFDDLVVDKPAVENTLVIETPLEPTPEPELAAILPDLSFEDSDDEGIDAIPLQAPEIPNNVGIDLENVAEEISTEAADSETLEKDKPESAVLPDLPDADSSTDSETLSTASLDTDSVADGEEVVGLMADTELDAVISDDLIAVIEAANEDAERTALEAVDGELDELTSDLEESAVFDADLPSLPVLGEAASPLESAAIPDLPEDVDSKQEQPMAAATQFPPEAEQARFEESIESDASDTSTDVTQFPPVESSINLLEDSPTNLETSSRSGSSTVFEAESGDSTFEELEELINNDSSLFTPPTAASSTVPERSITERPPVDFDDDLDFFQSEPPVAISPATHSLAADLPAADQPSTEGDVLAEPDLPIAGAAVGLAGAVGVGVIAQETQTEDGSAESNAVQDSATGTVDQEPTVDEGDDDPTGGEPADWFLGVDFGATGMSAVLTNQRGEQVYPLCWNIEGDSEANRFRLPTVVQLNTTPANGYQLGEVGPTALQQASPLLRNLKLMVKAGIPDDAAATPWMQWADHVALPLVSMQSSIVDLLKMLSADYMSCKAVGITSGALRRALADLKGVVVGYPTNWPDTYSFNLREAVLSAGLVSSPDRVFFVEEAIAALLSALPAPKVANDIPENQQPGLYNCSWSGGTVVISAGAVLTETAVTNLPSELERLSYSDFSMRGYTYAGDGIDQDIICQLLHLPLKAQGNERQSNKLAGQSLETSSWATLGLSEIPLPQPGEADRVVRHRLRQRLNDSSLGREAVLAARELKIALQDEEEVEVELGDHTWIVTSKDLETKVFLPYIQRINRQVNALLSKQNLASQDVKQVVCTGGSASLGAIARWLRQKFPNATIIQDTYSGEYSNSCSRVAYGLANLCQYPNVLDGDRHQYNDYFLLLELLRILPEQPLPAGGILHLLEQRGINTQACQAHVLALIEGHLPPGLVPTSGDRPLISAQSSDIATYKGLSELPLFRKQGGQIYIADPQQGDRLRSHLENLLATKAQSLSEPMTTEALTAAVGV